MRYVLAGILCATTLSCRDILPFSNETAVDGYQLDGTVTTSSGVPIDSVSVYLYFDYDFVTDEPIDTERVVVTRPLSFVDIAVYTPAFQFVRQLFFDYRSTGVVPRARWNGRDMNGNLVPSGKYLIRYAVDTAIVKFSPVIIDGHVSARTDAGGYFTLLPARFPVGDVVDLRDGADEYIGTYRVTSSVNIDFRKLSLHKVYDNVNLQRDKVTSRIFILQ